MLLTLCYICPPLAVMLMGRPFASMMNMFMIFGGWGNMVKHALVCYADRRGREYKNDLVGSINGLRGNMGGSTRQRSLPEPEQQLIDDPHVGAHGTRFKRKQ